ncbi:MAG: YihY/virulence factor BrkB family protein, partial [Bacteriovoracaceae bacterium]|nr:YihY/virulence factor BrkB family protein [Bacteriovoracaceae bacterium]
MTRKKEKLKRVLKAIQNKADIDNIFLMSSSVAFHSFLSFIPIISVLVGIYLILNFNLDWGHFSLVKEFVPPEVYNMVERQAERINTNLNTINIATAFSFLISLWLANNVTRTLAQSLNIVFDKKNEKHFLFSLGESILYTLLLISSFLFLGLMLTVLPILFSLVEFAQKWEFLFLAVQWVVIAFYMVFGLCFVYKYLPAHGTKISWKQFLPGALVATGFGSAFALMFSFYVSNFGSYSKVYGALGVIIITMLWLRLTFASILFGGEVNYFLLKDPSLREYFSLKSAFHDKLEDQTIKINWVRSVSVVFVIVLVGFRLYLPSKISKDIKDRFIEAELNFNFSDVDIQTFFGDYHLEDVAFKSEHG